MIKNITLSAILTLCVSCHVSSPLFQYKEGASSLTKEILTEFYETKEPLLAPGDKISISIWSHNDMSVGSVNNVYSSTEASGKWLLVDDDGNVNIPRLGRLKLSGITVNEANYLLEQKYGETLRDPIINVRVLNHFITVLGEVNNPGRYRLENEKLSLVEAVGLAGGLTDYSENQSIDLVRIVDGEPIKFTLDLTNINALPKEDIVLKSRDVIYINHTRLKTWDKNLAKISLITSIITGIAVLVSSLAR